MIAFLQPWLWLAGLLVAAPLWLHLLRRLPEGAVRFSALRFLDDEPLPKRRGLRFRDALLLALRLAALVLLVGAFARPLLPDTAATVSRSRVHILDNTLSHQVGGRWDQAHATLLDRLEEAPTSVQDAVVVLGARPEVLAGFGDGRETALQRVRGLTPSHQRGSYLEAYRLAQTLLDGGLGDDREIVFYGDHQANQWSEDATSPPFLRDLTVDLATEAVDPSTLPGNLTLSSPRARLFFVGDETLVDLTAELSHRGLGEATLRLDAGGLRVHERRLELDPKGSTLTVRAQWVINPEAWVEGVVTVEAEGDGLAADDQAYFAVPPVREGRVALLARSPYLRLALDPEVMRGRWRSQVLSSDLRVSDPAPDAATEEIDTELADVLVIEASLAQGQDARTLVRRYLDHGRGVVLLLDRVTPLVRTVLDDLGLHLGTRDTAEPSQSFRYFAVHHPIFRPFADGDLGDLTTVRVHRSHPLASRVARPLIYGDGGSALLVEGLRSKGRLLVFTFGFDPQGTDWALQPSFIPFLDMTLQYARAGTALETDRQPGERFLLPLESGQTATSAQLVRRPEPTVGGASMPPASPTSAPALAPQVATADPGGDPGPDEVPDTRPGARLVVDEGVARGQIPDAPGLYAVHLDTEPDPWTLLAVNPSALEGELEVDAEAATLESWMLPPTPQEELEPTLATAPTREGRLWWWLLCLGAVALAVETVLLWRGGSTAAGARAAEGHP